MAPFGENPGTPVQVTTAFETRLMARVLAVMFGLGATLAGLTVVLPHEAAVNESGLLAIVAIAYLTCALLRWRENDLRRAWLPYGLGFGGGLVTGVAYFSAESPSPLVFLYLWVVLYAGYFFSRRETAVQMVLVAAQYGALMLAAPPPNPAAWWVVGVGTLFVGAGIILTMRERVESLIAQLYDSARTDPLTKLYNRRGFRELLDLELERSRRGEGTMAVLVGDLDHFKEVNDRSGHHVGDAVLRMLATILSEGKRQIDIAGRVGGEEFALILPGTDRDGAFILAERLRADVQEAFSDATVPVTISFGIATHPEHGETAAGLLRSADEALYAAKESGRNRTVIHSELLRDSGVRRDIEGERYSAVVIDLAEAVDLRFSGSARHSETVGRYAEMMARELGFSDTRIGRVRLAGMLHDVGKVGVPDAVLSKPGKLTPEEWHEIRRHPELGAQILEHPSLADVRAWVAAHHERPDGTGYPLGLSGDRIPIEARILAVADAYEAMTADRPYSAALGHEHARAELARCSGTQFDPAVVRAFLKVLHREAVRAYASAA
jgi:diguanylate cyclase (GGDEF)-like protein/putative nucleotidyltransferase with HDIG domain